MTGSYLTLGTVLRYLAVLIIVGGFVLYVLFQSRLILGGPHLELSREPNPIQDEPFVTLEGVAENIVSITLNDRPILTTERGHFKEEILLPPGYTIVSIEAKDRYGRTTRIERSFVYTPIIEPNAEPAYGNEENSESDQSGTSTEGGSR